MDLEKAKLSDAILLKFRGNITVSWDEIKEGAFNAVHSDYYVIENRIKFLLGENVLKQETKIGVKIYLMLSMTDKGWAIMTDMGNAGYVAKAIKERNNLRWLRAVQIAVIIGVIAGVIRVWLFLYPCLGESSTSQSNIQDEQSNKAIQDTSEVEFVPLDIDTVKEEKIDTNIEE